MLMSVIAPPAAAIEYHSSSLLRTISNCSNANAPTVSCWQSLPPQPPAIPMHTTLQFDDKIHPMSHGRYFPIDIIGNGTYGQVIKCIDTSTNSHVAVKIAHRDSAYRRSALNEAHALRLLSGGHDVVQVLDSFEDNGRVCIVTEMLHKNLFEVLRESGAAASPVHNGNPNTMKLLCGGGNGCGFRLDHIRQVGLSVLSALSRLHHAGYMHCDIKPENIMFRRPNDFSDVCLIDFGAVRQFHENQYYDVQSLWYRAPEVLMGVPYTTKVDSWSVGCVLFELCVGSALFPGENAADQLRRIFIQLGQPCPDVMMRASNKDVMQQFPFQLPPPQEHPFHTIRRMIKSTGRFCGSEEEIMAFADVIVKLITPTECKRLSCAEALHHPFFTTSFHTSVFPMPQQTVQQKQQQCHYVPQCPALRSAPCSGFDLDAISACNTDHPLAMSHNPQIQQQQQQQQQHKPPPYHNVASVFSQPSCYQRQSPTTTGPGSQQQPAMFIPAQSIGPQHHQQLHRVASNHSLGGWSQSNNGCTTHLLHGNGGYSLVTLQPDGQPTHPLNSPGSNNLHITSPNSSVTSLPMNSPQMVAATPRMSFAHAGIFGAAELQSPGSYQRSGTPVYPTVQSTFGCAMQSGVGCYVQAQPMTPSIPRHGSMLSCVSPTANHEVPPLLVHRQSLMDTPITSPSPTAAEADVMMWTSTTGFLTPVPYLQ